MEKKEVQYDITPEECLNALTLLTKFIDQEEESCNDIEWKDKNGLGFSGDMGYFFEGLDAFESYLEERIERKKVENQ